MSELLQKEFKFSMAIPLLLNFIMSKDCQYKLNEGFVHAKRKSRSGENFDDGVHSAKSLHYIGLALDLNIFYRGKLMTLIGSDPQYQGAIGRYLLEKHQALYDEIGIFWESLDHDFKWGGRFGDANHFSCTHQGVKCWTIS